MKIAICDDDILFLKKLHKQLSEIPYVKIIDSFFEFDKLENELLGADYDVIMMDIEWKQKHNGVDVAAELWEKKTASKIIYVTSYVEKFIEQVYLKKNNVAGFLVKPVSDDRLRRCLDVIHNNQENNQNELVVLKNNGNIIALEKENILYIESDDHYLNFYTITEKYRILGRISDYEKKLANLFVRCHKGYLINMNYINRINTNEICLKNNTVITVGKKYSSEAKEKYLNYLADKI